MFRNVNVNICWTVVTRGPERSALLLRRPTPTSGTLGAPASPPSWPPSPRRRRRRPPRRSLSLAAPAAGRAPSRPCPSPP